MGKGIKVQHMEDLVSDLRLLLNTKYTEIFRISGTNLLAINLFRLLKEDVENVNNAHNLVSIKQGTTLENVITLTLPVTDAARAIQLTLAEELNFIGETIGSNIVLVSPHRQFYETLN